MTDFTLSLCKERLALCGIEGASAAARFNVDLGSVIAKTMFAARSDGEPYEGKATHHEPGDDDADVLACGRRGDDAEEGERHEGDPREGFRHRTDADVEVPVGALLGIEVEANEGIG